jgi:uncharacterized protein YjbJ (UPF0337 family)
MPRSFGRPLLASTRKGIGHEQAMPRLLYGSTAPSGRYVNDRREKKRRKEAATVENWKQITGKVKEQWGKLTEDDLTVINGKQDQLVGRVQERYRIAKDEAER